MQLLSRLLGRSAEFSAPLSPDKPFYVVGDVHGRSDLLEALLSGLPERADRVVLVGDYIDRGDDSVGVLQYLWTLQHHLGPEKVVCLKGNHEDMLLRFIDDPARHANWLRTGGMQTLASFGLNVLRSEPDIGELIDLANTLRNTMGPELVSWMRALPTRWQSGNVAVVHAGADPQRPIAAQDDHTCMWGHENFMQMQRSDGVWVVHGHTIVETPMAQNGVISVDTGAFSSGKLTAALIAQSGVEFLST
ncbi:serine/threonine protein phosphatase [Aliishimia ponticola]|uniref:Serine/threonine protein phosphatase n=1 Tax=Aliishimia ponticola TaxID=2499833 RepID=A0A4S4N8H3_9RHOB|nr:metallophosphoesterase family protein [Aliishimia ponticola]THH35429.1 serine/threonine protein phosphatase [Aliishimia ponticola]